MWDGWLDLDPLIKRVYVLKHSCARIHSCHSKSERIFRLTGVVEQRKILKKRFLHTCYHWLEKDLRTNTAALHTEDVKNVAASRRRIRLGEQWRRKYTEYQAIIQRLLPFLSLTWPFKKLCAHFEIFVNFSKEEEGTVAIINQEMLQVKKNKKQDVKLLLRSNHCSTSTEYSLYQKK